MARKERDARRRRLVVAQQEAAQEAERRSQVDAMVAALSKQSQAEQELAARLWQVCQGKMLKHFQAGPPGDHIRLLTSLLWFQVSQVLHFL